MERSYGFLSKNFQNKHFFITHVKNLHNKGVVFLKKVWSKSIAALHRLTQDVQYSTRYPKTHVGGPDLDSTTFIYVPFYLRFSWWDWKHGKTHKGNLHTFASHLKSVFLWHNWHIWWGLSSILIKQCMGWVIFGVMGLSWKALWFESFGGLTLGTAFLRSLFLAVERGSSVINT